MAKTLIAVVGPANLCDSDSDWDDLIDDVGNKITERSGSWEWNRPPRVSGNGNAVRFVVNTANYLGIKKGFQLIGDESVWFISVAFLRNLDANNLKILEFWDHQTGVMQAYITTSIDGTIKVFNGDDVQQAVSAAGSMANNLWTQWSIRFEIGNSASVRIDVEGTQRISATGLDTQNSASSNAFADGIRFRPNITLDDVVIHRGLTSDLMTPPRVVRTSLPNDDDAVQWTRSGGAANYETVDEGKSGNDDTDYVETATVSNQDTYEFQNVSNTTAIDGIGVFIAARKTSAAVRKIQMVTKSGATTDTHATEQSLFSPNYQTYTRLLENDPNTGSPWAESALNSAKHGQKLST